MNMPDTSPVKRTGLHPLLILAAVAVILFSIVGTAAIMGWLPSSRGDSRNGLTDAERAALSANTQTIQPGQPGYVAPGTTTYPNQPVLPSQTVQQSQATVPVQVPYGSQALASSGAGTGGYNSYGYSGVQGSTGSGSPDYAPVEPKRTAPRTEHHTRVATADTDEHWCSTCGNVESVRAITNRARGSGVGAAGGAILGGLLGNQVGSGHGRQLATVAGAVGGAVLGNQVEGNMKANTTYEIRVRLDDGKLRTFHQASAPQWRTGDRVRIVKGSLHAA